MTASTEENLQDIINSSPPNILHRSTPDIINPAQISPQSSSSYTLANDQSVFSRDVDNWMRGYSSPTESTGIQGSRIATVQRSTLVNSTADASGFWYVLAAMLPLFSTNRGPWRCTPSSILYTAELFLLKLGRMCSLLSHEIRRLANNQYSREIFASVMDFIIVVYAIGFLMLSMYQNTFNGVQQQ